MAKKAAKKPVLDPDGNPPSNAVPTSAEQPLPVPLFPKTDKTEVNPNRVIEKAWKQGAHARAAELIIAKTGSMGALIEAIPEDEKLIRETLAQRGVY